MNYNARAQPLFRSLNLLFNDVAFMVFLNYGLGVIVCVLYIFSGLFVVLLFLCFKSLGSFTEFYTEDEPNYVLSEEREPQRLFFKFLFQIYRCVPDTVL